MIIIYETEAGISIIHPTGELSIEEVFKKDVPDEYKSTAKIVEDDVIPEDRTFRNTWKHEEGQIVEDIEKSKSLWKEKLRLERKPLFDAQDTLFMKALESNADTSLIIKEKQRLRDITKLVEVCAAIDEIKAIKI